MRCDRPRRSSELTRRDRVQRDQGEGDLQRCSHCRREAGIQIRCCFGGEIFIESPDNIGYTGSNVAPSAGSETFMPRPEIAYMKRL